MGVKLDLSTDKDGEIWNLSSLQGWLATSSLCSITVLATLDSQCSQFVLKGIICHIKPRDREASVVHVHCSCQRHVLEDIEGHLKCERCQSKGIVEMTCHNNTLKVGETRVTCLRLTRGACTGFT